MVDYQKEYDELQERIKNPSDSLKNYVKNDKLAAYMNRHIETGASIQTAALFIDWVICNEMVNLKGDECEKSYKKLFNMHKKAKELEKYFSNY
jgi:hypothetical protein